MSLLELVAVLLGLANVALLVRRSVWNYPFGLAMVSLYALIFREARLYSDALLQLFFFVLNAWGWWLWTRNRAAAGEVIVRFLAARQIAAWSLVGVLSIAVWGAIEARWTDAAFPWMDAGVAIASVIAQILLARRYVENWPVWIAVDLVSILLYAMKGLYLTMGLYVLFLSLAALGWREWLLAARKQATGAAA